MKPSNENYQSAICELINSLDDIKVTHAQCGIEFFWISFKAYSFKALLLMNHFAAFCNFKMPSWSDLSPYSEKASENPADDITHRIMIESHRPDNQEALFTLQTLGCLIINHHKVTGKISSEEAIEASKFWKYTDDEV